MYKKIVYSIIFFLLVNTLLLASQNITVESTGISVIKDEVTSTRENALNDAFRKAIKKVLKNILNLSDNSSYENILSNANRFINGYEIIEEKQIGNILNEKIKVSINLPLLEKAVDKTSSTQLVYVAIFCSNDNSSTTIDEKCSDFIKRAIRDIPNTIFLPYQQSLDSTFSEVKDLLIVVNYKLTQEKKIYSIEREFDNVSMTLSCYNSRNEQIVSETFNTKILRGFNESIFDKFDANFVMKIEILIRNIIEKIQNEQAKSINKNIEYLLFVNSPKNYLQVKSVTELLDKFNVQYRLYEIKNNSFIFKIKGKNVNEILKIFRFANFKFKYIRADGNITIGF